MSVKIEKQDNQNELKLEFTIEAKIFEEGMKTVYKKNAKYFSIPGFRKGKVPMNMVEKFYGAQIFYEDTFNEIVPEIYENSIKEEKLEVVSHPEIDVVQMEKGKDLIFTALVQIKPEVKLGKYKGISLEKNKYEVTEHDVEHELEHMADRNSRMVTVTNRAAKLDDTVVIDFCGSVDGKEFEGGKAENHELKLGSNTFIPGFETQIVGMKTEEEKDIKVTFPEEYFSKELAGKDAVFKVKVHEIKEKELPKIDDEFAKDVSEFDTLKELKADIKAKKEEQNENRSKNELQEAAVRAVAEVSEVDIPSGMIETEVEGMVEDMNQRLAYQGISLEQYLPMVGKTMEDYKKENEEPAKESVKMRLVLEAVSKDAKIEVKDQEIDEKIKELATAYGRKEEELKENEELKKNIEATIRSEKSIDYIIDNAKVKETVAKEECDCGHEHGNEKKAEKAAKKTTKKAAAKEESEEKAKKDTKKTTKK